MSLLLSSGAMRALDIKMADGTVYANIRLEKKTSLGIWVSHEAGRSFLDYLAMTEPDRTAFGYQEKSYKATVTRMASQTAKAQAAAAPVDSTARNLSSSPAGTAPSVKCAAMTKKGTPCSRTAQEGSAYCWQHAR
jgi:hypothetical protein